MAFSIRSLFSKSDSADDSHGSATVTMEPPVKDQENTGKPTNSTMQQNPFSGASLFKTSNPGEAIGQPIGAGFQSPFSPFGAQSAGGLTVGDILPQLPPDVAKAGLQRELPLHMPEDVMEKAMRSPQPALPLFEIYRVCPALFQTPISPNDPRQVMLPPHKTEGRPAPAPVGASPFTVLQAKAPEGNNPIAAVANTQIQPAQPTSHPEGMGLRRSPVAAPAPTTGPATLNPFMSAPADSNPFAAAPPAPATPFAAQAPTPTPLPTENPFATLGQPAPLQAQTNPFMTSPTATVSAVVPANPQSPFASPFAMPTAPQEPASVAPTNPFALPTQPAGVPPLNPFAQHTPTHPLAPVPPLGAPSLEAVLMTSSGASPFGMPTAMPPIPYPPVAEAAPYPPVQPAPQGMEGMPFTGFEPVTPPSPSAPYPAYMGMLAPHLAPVQSMAAEQGPLFPPAPPVVAPQSMPLPFQKILSIGKDEVAAPAPVEQAPAAREPNPFAGFGAAPSPAPALPIFPPATSLLSSEPASAPVAPMPAGENDTIKLSLLSALKRCNQQELGMSPDLIPSWINVNLQLAPLRSQLDSGRVQVKLATIIAGLDETFRSLLINARPDTIVELSPDDVFHASSSPAASNAMPLSAETIPTQAPTPTPVPAQASASAELNEAFNPFAAAQQPWEQPAAPMEQPQAPISFFDQPTAPVAESEPVPSPFLPAPSILPAAEVAPTFFAEPAASASSFLDLSLPVQEEVVTPFAPYVPASKLAESTIRSPFSVAPEEPIFQTATAPVSVKPPAPEAPVITADKQTRNLLLRALLGAVAQDAASIIQATSQQQGVAAVVCLNDGKEIASAGTSTAEADNFRKRAAVVLGHLKPVIAETGIEGTETFSMRSDNRHVVTYSFQGPTTLCVLHDSSHHDTGLPEKLTLIAREVAQILRETPPS